MIDPGELMTGKDWMEIWYEWNEPNPHYLAYLSFNILKYDLTVIDRIEHAGTKDEKIIGLSSETLVNLLKNDIQSLPSRWLYTQQLSKIWRNFKLHEPDPKIDLWFQILGIPPKYVLNELERLEPNLANHSNVFVKFGQAWLVKYNQEGTILNKDEKYDYIAHILNPSNIHKTDDIIEHKISNIELVSRVKKQEGPDPQNSPKRKRPRDGDSEQNSSDENVYVEDSLYEYFSKKEINGYRKIGLKILDMIKVAELTENQAAKEDAINSLDLYKTNLAEQKIDCFIDEAKGKISLKPKAKLKPEHDRIRQLVKNQIENAIKTIEKGMPKLSRHLRRSIIRKSEYTIYSPENPTEWFVKF